jgi:peptidoglycan LD-endopeptidase LytH
MARIFGGVALLAMVIGAPAPASAIGIYVQSAGRVDAAVTIPPSDTAAVTQAGAGPIAEPTGPFLCPVSGANFTNDWGQPRSGGRRHEGTDMLAPRGTPIVASAAGVVKRSSSATGGLTFNLVANDGFTYVGMHLSAYGGAEGAVAAGDLVGYVGDSGNAKGTNHLHFEIQVTKGRKLNPFATLRRFC